MQNPCSPNFVMGIHQMEHSFCGTVEQAAKQIILDFKLQHLINHGVQQQIYHMQHECIE